MGTGYDWTDLKGHTAAPSITPAAAVDARGALDVTARSPVNASRLPSRTALHHSGPVRFATPSP
jgi:hypothetical protein